MQERLLCYRKQILRNDRFLLKKLANSNVLVQSVYFNVLHSHKMRIKNSYVSKISKTNHNRGDSKVRVYGAGLVSVFLGVGTIKPETVSAGVI